MRYLIFVTSFQNLVCILYFQLTSIQTSHISSAQQPITIVDTMVNRTALMPSLLITLFDKQLKLIAPI